MLLLFFGAGQAAAAGVRAYATISFRVVTAGDLSFRTVVGSTLTVE